MDKLYISAGKSIRTIFLLVAVWLLPCSCLQDGEEAPAGAETDVNITIKLPKETATRALGTTDENQVNTVDVLVFDAVTHGFLYTAFGHTITGSGTTRTFSVTLAQSTGNVDMDFVVNARPWIAAAYPSGIAMGTLRSDVQKALAATVSPRWIADKTDTGYKPLPMWGSRDGVTVDQALASSGMGTIDVVRMLAAVNIELSAAAQTAFQLEYVYLYNYNTKGLLKPDTETPGVWNSTLHRAIEPSLPTAPGSTKGPLVFDNSAPLDDKTHYTGEIYLFEAFNGGAADYPDIPCLVIGGKYLGPDGLSTPQDAFYRVDLTSVDAFNNVTYLDILRNHKYTVTVNSVASAGLPDEDEAYNSVRADIEVKITDWDLGGNVVLDPTGQRYLWLSDLEFEADPAGETFTMTLDTDATSWKAVVSESDVNPNAGGATWLTVSPATGGPGTHTLTITVPDNDDLDVRTAYIHVVGDDRFDAVIKVEQDYVFDLGTITPSPFTYGYVGAFWKKDQTGERIITIPHTSNGIYGAWKATVVEGAEWIVLDDKKTSDPNIRTSSTADMNIAANDALYQVTGNATSVSGNAASTDIYFRIGLKSTYTPPADGSAPARYGLIVLSYNDKSEESLLFIRQGEDPDYLMRPEDNNGDGTITTEWGGTAAKPRPDARKWSPYNLTAAEFKAGSMSNAIQLPQRLPVGNPTSGGGVFTDYPSQGGAYFLWGGDSDSGRERMAYTPVGYFSYPVNSTTAAFFWDGVNGLRDTREGCPLNYRRATDGSTLTESFGDIAVSEMRQSLYLDPFAGVTFSDADEHNILWGYYADGYFDRREIYNSVMVDETSAGAAFMGTLFYNPESYASLFLPSAGYRHGSSSGLLYKGQFGYYWSSSATKNVSPRGLALYLQTDFVIRLLYQAGIDRYYACSVRCVLDD